jgi:hypothetical protein
VRNSISLFKLSKELLTENLIYNILYYNNYKVYSGLNWKFEFSFYAKPLSWILSPNKEKDTTIFVHISNQKTKEEIRKEVNKLNKIKEKWKKYLLIDSLEKFNIKKTQYEEVKIIEVEEFLLGSSNLI